MVKAFLLGSHRGLRLCWCRELIHCVVMNMYMQGYMSYNEGVVHCILTMCLKNLNTNQKLRRVLLRCRVLCSIVGVTEDWVSAEDVGRNISVQDNALELVGT